MSGADIVIIGLSITSSWGNGHATTYRALTKALARRGHRVTFLERDVPWYASHRDLPDPPWCRALLYRDRSDLEARHGDLVRRADAVIVGSYVPDGVAVGGWAISLAGGMVAFYDIDTPVTLARLERGEEEYLNRELVAGYDLYLSFTGGPTLARIEAMGSPRAAALYCSADPREHYPVETRRKCRLGYLGTYSADRQPALERLLFAPARALPGDRFAVAGPQYPESVAWPGNVKHIPHLAPSEHCAFYSAQSFTLNVTRSDMREAGWSPSVRLFEAACCGVPIISDRWAGLESFLEPGREILTAESGDDVLAALRISDAERRAVAKAARERVLAEHTPDRRAAELERLLFGAADRPSHDAAQPVAAE
ncbi:MAG TPA: glycosyltransferase [Afifellaceae bacterium]|nr:glycosyltransferase [Afifellaceae bacterium]